MASSSDFLKLSFSSLKRRKLRSGLTMLGIIIGIAAVVALISLGDGLRTAVTGQFSTLSADKLTIQNAGTGFGPPGSTSVRKLTEHDLKLIRSVNGVDYAVPRMIRIGKFEYNKVASFRYIADLPNDQKAADIIYSSFDAKIDSGRLLKPGENGKILLGHSFQNDQEFGKEIVTGSKIIIQGKSFEVIGILKESSSFQLNVVGMMSTDDLKSLLNIGDEIDLIVAQIKDPKQTEAVGKRIEDRLRRDRDEKLGEEDFSVQTPLQAISSINTILNIINLIVTGIAAISLIIGGIGIANTMYTSIMERTKEIGTMKAVGATNKDILTMFVVESGLLGLIGGVVGAFLGLGMASAASGIANAAFGGTIISVVVSYPLFFGAIGFSFLIGILSGFIPAFQASKLKPVDALRS